MEFLRASLKIPPWRRAKINLELYIRPQSTFQKYLLLHHDIEQHPLKGEYIKPRGQEKSPVALLTIGNGACKRTRATLKTRP